jgi:mannosyl-oligosaccharide alpha-1,2-mannosidase
VSQPHRADHKVVLAELASLSVEFTRLAQLTRENKYYDAIARITNELQKVQNSTMLPGMWPVHVDISGCKPPEFHSTPLSGFGTGTNNSTLNQVLPNSTENSHPVEVNSNRESTEQNVANKPDSNSAPMNRQLTSRSFTSPSYWDDNCEEQGITSPPHTSSDKFGLGGMSDSAYEYLPKEYMLLGGVTEQYQSMYVQAVDTVRKYLLFRPMIKADRDIRFVATVAVRKPHADRADAKEAGPSLRYEYEGTHLTCFAGGMFGIGAKLFEIDGDMEIATQLTDGCVWAYESTATGIMPEVFELLPCEDTHSCPWNETRYRKALDPNEVSRVNLAGTLHKKPLKVTDDVPAEFKGKVPSVITSMPKDSASSSSIENHPSKREFTPAEQASEESEQPLREGSKSGVADPTVTPALIPTFMPPVLSHEEYVNTRIKEERIPSGFLSFQSRNYLLRPEAIESVFIMFRLTGDPIWREKGWAMFEAVNRHTRTMLAYSAINDVTSAAPVYKDSMESFWLAETLKYSYLLFSDPNVVSLDEYVL